MTGDDDILAAAPLGGTRTEAMQRLQIGLTGLTTIIVLVGLASVIGGQAELAEEAAVPDAAPTTEPTEAPAQSDPLADAGVVPDIPAEPETAQEPAIVPDIDPPAKGLGAPDGSEGRVLVPDTPPTEPEGAPSER